MSAGHFLWIITNFSYSSCTDFSCRVRLAISSFKRLIISSKSVVILVMVILCSFTTCSNLILISLNSLISTIKRLISASLRASLSSNTLIYSMYLSISTCISIRTSVIFVSIRICYSASHPLSLAFIYSMIIVSLCSCSDIALECVFYSSKM